MSFRQQDLLQRVNDICSLVNQVVDPDELLRLSLTHILDLFHARRGSIFLYDARTRTLHLKAAQGMEEGFDSAGLAKCLGQGIVGKVAWEKVPLVVEDISRDPRFSQYRPRRSYRSNSFICAPLLIKDCLIGVINISEREGGARFTKDEVSLLDFLATQIALNHRRIELYRKMKGILRDSRLLQDELHRSNELTRRLSKKVVVQEKLASLGKLAGGIAHEFNNPLDGVLRYTNLCLELTQDNEVLQGYLNEIRSGLQRMAGIVRSLLAYARQDTGPAAPVDWERMLAMTVKSLEPEAARKKAAVAVDCDADLPRLPDLGLSHIISNLARNALDAVGEGGRVGIRITHQYGTLIIKVEDNGRGIPQDCLEDIFEPFYTTKEIDQGCGLGLTIVSEIVKAYGGRIEVASEIGQGTLMTVVIPLNPKETNAGDIRFDS